MNGTPIRLVGWSAHDNAILMEPTKLNLNDYKEDLA